MWLCVYVCLYCLKLEQKTANYNISLVESVYNMCVLETEKVNLMKKNTFCKCTFLYNEIKPRPQSRVE